MKIKKVLSRVVLLCVLLLGTIVTVGAASDSGYFGGNNSVSISKEGILAGTYNRLYDGNSDL